MLISVSVYCLQGTTLPYGYCRENRKLIAFNYDIYNTGCMWWILEKCNMTKKEPNFEYTAHLRCGIDFQASDLPKRNGPALCWRPSRNHCWFRNPQRKDISDIAVKMKEGLEKLKRWNVVCLVGRMDTLFQFWMTYHSRDTDRTYESSTSRWYYETTASPDWKLQKPDSKHQVNGKNAIILKGQYVTYPKHDDQAGK